MAARRKISRSVTAVAAALIIGLALAIQLMYVYSLRMHVDRLQNEVCGYQAAAVKAADELAAQGVAIHPVVLPPPQKCP